MSDRRVLTLTLVVAAALVGVIVAGALVGVQASSADLSPRVRTAVSASGLEDVRVVVRGREVTVADGTLGELTEAMAIAARVPGVRSAAIDRSPGSVDRIDTTRPYLRLRRDAGRLRILGAVPTAAAAATVKSSAARAFGVPVRGDLDIDPALPGAAWTTQLPVAFGDLVGIAGMDLTIDGSTVRLRGSIDTAAERDDVLRLVRNALPGMTVQADVQLGAAAEAA